MWPLNFPPLPRPAQESYASGYIFDPFRKRRVRLTAEEWVRQHLAHYLVTHLGHPKGRVKLEHPFFYGKKRQRADLLVYSATGHPWLVAECKAPEVSISLATWQQVARYTYVLQAPVVVVTNGLEHFCCKKDTSTSPYLLSQIPRYST